MDSIAYLNTKYSRVTNLGDFLKSRLPEMIQIRSLLDNIKLLFGISSNRIIIDVAEDNQRIYKFTLLNPNISQNIMGWIIFMPLIQGLDIYTVSTPNTPLIQWRKKKIIFKNYDLFLDRVGFDKLFNKLLNSI